jgi:predicted nucleic acid-binding Zn ribbon protein
VILSDATLCTICKSPQGSFLPCVKCGRLIDKKASVCSNCQALQHWRRSFSLSTTVLSLLIALIAVMSPAITAYNYLRDYHSRTSFIVTDFGDKTISVYVWNTGSKPSALSRSLLILGNVPLATLEPSKSDRTKTVIPPHDKAILELSVAGLTEKGIALESSKQSSTSSSESPALLLEIEESDGSHRRLEVPLSLDVVLNVIRNR